MKNRNVENTDLFQASSEEDFSLLNGPFSQKRYDETTSEEKIDIISGHFRAIMETLGLDLSDPSLMKTPERVAKMYVHEIFSGLHPEAFPSISMFPAPADSCHHTGFLITKTSFISFCEHHFVPMIGTAYIAYIPNNAVIGLSKISRIVRYFSSRPQLQERLTDQISRALQKLFKHENLAILIEAEHLCVLARGVKDEDSTTTTLRLCGTFKKDSSLQQQFFELVKIKKTEKETSTSPLNYFLTHGSETWSQ